MEASPALQHALEAINGRLHAIEEKLGQLENSVRATQVEVKRLTNYNRYEGNVVHYDVVPFLDGSDPTQAQHGLPPLRSQRSVDDLDGAQIGAYLRGYGYGQGGPHGRNEEETHLLQKDLLKRTIAGRS